MGFCPGAFCPGGFCPGGFCPGIYVRGVFVRGVFVLIPSPMNCTTPNEGVQSPEGMKFPDFSRLRLNSYVCSRLLIGLWGHAIPENFQNQDAENGFHTTKFPDFSLTFLVF